MSESKMFPNRNFITRKKNKTKKKNLRNLQENDIHDYVIILRFFFSFLFFLVIKFRFGNIFDSDVSVF